MNPPKILIYSAGHLREILKESTWKIPLNFHVDSCSLTTQISPRIPLRHVSAIPGDSLRNPRDFARWDAMRYAIQFDQKLVQRNSAHCLGNPSKWHLY